MMSRIADSVHGLEAARLIYGNLSDLYYMVIWQVVPEPKFVPFPTHYRRFIEAAIINHPNYHAKNVKPNADTN